MKNATLTCLLLLVLCQTAWGTPVMNNSAASANSAKSDSIYLPFVHMDSLGHLVQLRTSPMDSVFILISAPSGVAYTTSANASSTSIVTLSIGTQVYQYYWRIAIADFDDATAAEAQGCYTWTVVTLFNSGSRWLNPQSGFVYVNTSRDYFATLDNLDDSLSHKLEATNPAQKQVDVTATGAVGIDLNNVEGTLSDAEVETITTDPGAGSIAAGDFGAGAITASAMATNSMTNDELDPTFLNELFRYQIDTVAALAAAAYHLAERLTEIYSEVSNIDGFNLAGGVTANSIGAGGITAGSFAANAIDNNAANITENLNTNVTSISADATAADNLESMLDGTGGQVLSLSQLRIVATASTDTGVVIVGSSDAEAVGVSIHGGPAVGIGMRIRGGATSGDAIQGYATGPAAGTNDVLDLTSDDGNIIRGNANAGVGLNIRATADAAQLTSLGAGDGLQLVGAGGGLDLNSTLNFDDIIGSLKTADFEAGFLTASLAPNLDAAVSTRATVASIWVADTASNNNSVGSYGEILAKPSYVQGAASGLNAADIANEIFGRDSTSVNAQGGPTSFGELLMKPSYVQGAASGLTAAAVADEIDNRSGAIAGAVTVEVGSVVANAIGVGDLAAGAVDANAIAPDAIGSSELATDAIGALEVGTDAIGAAEVAASAITATEAPLLGNLDATVSSRSTLVASDNIGVNLDDVAGRLDSNEVRNDLLNASKLDVGTITSSEAPALANLDATVSSRSTLAVTDNVGLNFDDVSGTLDDAEVGTITVDPGAGLLASGDFAAGAITGTVLDATAIDAIWEYAAASVGSSTGMGRFIIDSVNAALSVQRLAATMAGARIPGYSDSVIMLHYPLTGAPNKDSVVHIRYAVNTPVRMGVWVYGNNNGSGGDVADTMAVVANGGTSRP